MNVHNVPRLCLLLLLGNSVAYERVAERRRAVPVLYVEGSHYDIGYDAGRTFSGIIKSFVSSYGNMRDLEREYRTPEGRAAYEQTLTNMRRRFPHYVRELQGTADGSGVPFHQLFLLQMDDVMLTINDNHIPRDDTGGCSDVGINRHGQAVLGHTEDAFGETLNHFYLIAAHVIPTPEDSASGAQEEWFTSLCYAGQLPGYTMGFNEHGLVFTINTLSPALLKAGNTPRTFMTRALLAAKTPKEADSILLDQGLGVANGFSVNMFWTDAYDRHQLFNVEVAPNLKGDHSILQSKAFNEEILVHCNLYLRLSVEEVIGPIIDSSHARLQLLKGAGAVASRQDVVDALSITAGKQYTVFQKKPDAIIKTIAAGIFDLRARTWSVYINEPNATAPVAELPLRFTQLRQRGVVVAAPAHTTPPLKQH